MKSPTPNDEMRALASAWSAQLRNTDAKAKALLQQIAKTPLHAFSEHFYTVMFQNERAARFLSSEQVQEHLKPALQRWLCDLLNAHADETERLLAMNSHIGIAHARIGIPVELVTRGLRELRLLLQQRIAALAGADAALLNNALYCSNLSLDIALEAMTQAYTHANEQSSRTDTAYRLFSLMQNTGTERERQRALLLDWENNLLYHIASDDRSGSGAQLLSASEFCLWFLHKGIPTFGESPESARIMALIGEIDAFLKEPAHNEGTVTARMATLIAIRERLDMIRNLLTTLFERIGELDAGSDSLTNLLNRRFLPTILRREIELTSRGNIGCAIALFDLDRFKEVNDQYGHETGDRILQLVADTLSRYARSSDYVFRLGGEEFVVVLGSVNAAQAQTIADALRQKVSQAPLQLNAGNKVSITVSVGVAMYDGHPDYMRMISRADAAMYAAKAAGRNCVMMAATEGMARQHDDLNTLAHSGIEEHFSP